MVKFSSSAMALVSQLTGHSMGSMGPRRRFAGTDPYVSFFFGIEVDGIMIGHAQEVSGLVHETSIVNTYQCGGDNYKEYKLMGRTKVGNITVKNGYSMVSAGPTSLWGWRQMVINDRKSCRKEGAVMILGEYGVPLARWEFSNAWPSKWTGPSFNSKSNDLAFENVEIACEELKRVL